MKRLLTLVLAILPLAAMASVEITSVQINGLTEPTGVDPNGPLSFSWTATSDEKGASQEAYEISVYRGMARVWHSGYVKSDNSVAIPFSGTLRPDSRYSVIVRIWDNKNIASKAVTTSWSTGLRAEDWKAEMVGMKVGTQPLNFRHTATLDKKIKRATAYITSHGQYEAYINGTRVGDAYMTPGWTSYNKRLQYQAFDVTSLLQRGENVVAAVV
jgi:alpha-L-rhamnosidase